MILLIGFALLVHYDAEWYWWMLFGAAGFFDLIFTRQLFYE